ncbi:Uncharacterised protein [Bacteroides xylanisolvens]|nr:Uncharacterised protein [Bacteroides xylanisolvens]
MRLDLQSVQHGIDVRAAAMDEDDIHADEMEKKDVLHDVFLQDGGCHGISAVLGDDVFAGIFFDVGDGLCQDLRPNGVVCNHIEMLLCIGSVLWKC